MTVAQAIKELQEQDPKAQLLLASDPEGNGYSPADEAAGGNVLVRGEVYGEDDEERPKGGKKEVVFWPRHWESH